MPFFREYPDGVTTQRCNKCYEVRPFAAFSKSDEGVCRMCKRLSRYRLEHHQYGAALKIQQKRCAICRKLFLSDKDVQVDHDHSRSDQHKAVVRGLLCAPCNKGLGMFRDSPDLLRAAAEYLEASVSQKGFQALTWREADDINHPPKQEKEV